MFFKRRKKLIPPYERTPDGRPFQVYEIQEQSKERASSYRRSHFVSPIFGENVKDEVVIPIKTNQKRNLDTLDPFRTKPRLTKEERIQKYGTAYPEFDLVRGKDLDEVMDSTRRRKQGQSYRARIVENSKDTDTGAGRDETAHQPEDQPPETRYRRPDSESQAGRGKESGASDVEAARSPSEEPGHKEAESAEEDFDTSRMEASRSTEQKSTPAADDSSHQTSTDEVERRTQDGSAIKPDTHTAAASKGAAAEESPMQERGATQHDGDASGESADTAPEDQDRANRTIVSGRKRYEKYQVPPIDLLDSAIEDPPDISDSIEKQTNILNETFAEFNVGARVYKHVQGPTVTRYEIAVEKGVKLNKITNIENNIKMKLGAKEIRIQAPIPGKTTAGIEVPNEQPATVHFLNIVNRSMFKNASVPLTLALGIDIDGQPIYTSIKSMPHGLIAGQTGSGKSVCINTVLMSLLLQYKPTELRLLLIDPKRVELAAYNDIPHLLTPVITDAQAATAALKWVIEEMERRFTLFNSVNARNIDVYNEKIENPEEHLPYIVIVIDELSDLMMLAAQHVEESVMRITQKARACGIHLIIATQRPSTDVIKGTIKSNIPTRIAFSVSSHIDSQTILDSTGAEKLLGNGDMLFSAAGQSQMRLQGAFIKDADIENVTEFIRRQAEPDYIFTEQALVDNASKTFEYDDLLPDVARFVVERQEASINKISKTFSIGFNRAQNIVESLESAKIVSGNLGSRAREVLVDEEELERILRTM